MKKIDNRGFMLVETLLVTSFVAGVLIYLFVQFSNLGQKYQNSYDYNPVEDLYALEDIKDYIKSDTVALEGIGTSLEEKSYIDITDCSIFTSKNYCKKLFELENIDSIVVSLNQVNSSEYSKYNEGFKEFVKKINPEGAEKYRLIASFKNSTYATLRLGDINE